MNFLKKANFLQNWVHVGVGDLTRVPADVLVNAANSTLLGGGGVDGVIHRVGGPAILEDCKQLRQSKYPDGLPTGMAVATGAGKLSCRWVIHTVGPQFGLCQGKEPELLRSCYWNSLVLARELGATSIAFPAISTGAFRYPIALAAAVVSETLTAIKPSVPGLKDVYLVFHTEDSAMEFLDNERFEVPASV